MSPEAELEYRIAARLALEAVERVFWHRVVVLHLPVFGCHRVLAAVAK